MIKNSTKDYSIILKYPFDKIIKLIFSPIDNIQNNKNELYFREHFISNLEQKYDFHLWDIQRDIDINKVTEKIYVANINVKKDLSFIFIKNKNKDGFELINFLISKEEDKYIKKNKGRSFIFLYNDTSFILLNTKDYFDLYLIKNKGDNNYILTNDNEELDVGTLLKKLKLTFRKMNKK